MVNDLPAEEGADLECLSSTMPASVTTANPTPTPSLAPEPESASVEMSFLDHLEELRWRLLKSLAAILVGAVICFVFSDALMKALTYPYKQAVLSMEADRPSGVVAAIEQWLRSWMDDAPAVRPAPLAAEPSSLPTTRQLQSLKPMTYFLVTLQVALMGGIMLALPVLFYQVWQFIAPGLLTREKYLLIPTVLFSVLCFAVGALIAYWLVLPLGLRFFLALEPPDMTSQWAVDEYIGFVLRLLLGFGIVFEMPVMTFLLARLGLLTPGYMRHIRRYAVVTIFVLAAIFTPPDPISQILMALPLLLLYEVSIWVCRIAGRDKRPAEQG